MGLSCEQNGKKLIGLIILWSKKNHLLLAFITMSTRVITAITTYVPESLQPRRIRTARLGIKAKIVEQIRLEKHRVKWADYE